jgi:hypothetical protein
LFEKKKELINQRIAEIKKEAYIQGYIDAMNNVKPLWDW